MRRVAGWFGTLLRPAAAPAKAAGTTAAPAAAATVAAAATGAAAAATGVPNVRARSATATAVRGARADVHEAMVLIDTPGTPGPDGGGMRELALGGGGTKVVVSYRVGRPWMVSVYDTSRGRHELAGRMYLAGNGCDGGEGRGCTVVHGPAAARGPAAFAARLFKAYRARRVTRFEWDASAAVDVEVLRALRCRDAADAVQSLRSLAALLGEEVMAAREAWAMGGSPWLLLQGAFMADYMRSVALAACDLHSHVLHARRPARKGMAAASAAHALTQNYIQGAWYHAVTAVPPIERAWDAFRGLVVRIATRHAPAAGDGAPAAAAARAVAGYVRSIATYSAGAGAFRMVYGHTITDHAEHAPGTSPGARYSYDCASIALLTCACLLLRGFDRSQVMVVFQRCGARACQRGHRCEHWALAFRERDGTTTTVDAFTSQEWQAATMGSGSELEEELVDVGSTDAFDSFVYHPLANIPDAWVGTARQLAAESIVPGGVMDAFMAGTRAEVPPVPDERLPGATPDAVLDAVTAPSRLFSARGTLAVLRAVDARTRALLARPLLPEPAEVPRGELVEHFYAKIQGARPHRDDLGRFVHHLVATEAWRWAAGGRNAATRAGRLALARTKLPMAGGGGRAGAKEPAARARAAKAAKAGKKAKGGAK